MSEQRHAIDWAGVMAIRNKRLLTLKEQDKPFYILPGGKVEIGEVDEEAALRELNEELGISAHSLAPFTIIEESSRTTGQLIRFKVFAGELDREPSPDTLPERTEATAWIDSRYKDEGLEVGNLLIKLIPILIEKSLIG